MPTLGNLDDIRTGLATNLSTISGLRAVPNEGQQILPPMALVHFPETVNYDETFGHGTDLYIFPITLYLSTAESRAASDALSLYLNKDGTKSFKVAIESDATLAGAAGSLRVLRARDVGFLDIDTVTYLVATWDVEIYA